MEKGTEIKKVILEVEGKEIILTVAGAKKLKELLSELFGKEIVKEVRVEHHDHYHPYKYYYGAPLNDFNKFYCGATSKFDSNTQSLLCSVSL